MGTRLTGAVVVWILAIAAGLLGAVQAADMVQSADLDMQAGGNDLLPGTGISFASYVWTNTGGADLDMNGKYIKNTVDTSGFVLDLGNYNLKGNGYLATTRANNTGPVEIRNVGTVTIGNIDNYPTVGATAGSMTITGQTGNVTAGFLNAAAYGIPGHITIAGNGGAYTSSYIYSYASEANYYGSNITITGYNSINVTNAGTTTSGHWSSGHSGSIQSWSDFAGGGGSVTLGQGTGSQRIGAGGVTLAGGIETRCMYAGGSGGAVNIVTLGAVSMTFIKTGIAVGAGNNGGTGGNIVVTNGGNAAFTDLTSNGLGGFGADKVGGDISLTGNDTCQLTANSISTFTASTVDSNGGGAGDITISHYNQVHIAGSATFGSYTGGLMTFNGTLSYAGHGGDITITNIGSGGVQIDYGLNTSVTPYLAGYTGGSASISAVGPITITGTIDLHGENGTTDNGVLNLESTGSTIITLASLDLSKVSAATLSAGGRHSVITNQLLNFPVSSPADGKLDATTSQVIHYSLAISDNSYLTNGYSGIFTLKSGGILTWEPPAVRGTVYRFR